MTQTPPEHDAAASTPAGPADESDLATLVRLAETDDGLPAALARLQALPQRLLLETVAQLGRIRESAVAALLLGVSESAGDRQARKEARRALHRLRDAGVQLPARSARPPAQLPSAGKFQIREARASFADGVGSRALWLLTQRHDGSGLMAVLILNDQVGLKACDIGPASPRQYRERVQRWEDQAGAELVELPVDYARQLIGEAVELNRTASFAVPAELARLENAVVDLHAPFDHALVYDELPAAEAQLVPGLMERTSELIELPELEGWFFDYDEARRYALQVEQARQSRILLSPELKERRETDILQNMLRDLVPDPVRHGLQRRLEETALLFLRLGRGEHARLALAAAVGLRDGAVSLHPFLLAMARKSVELAIQATAAGIPVEELRHSARDPIL